ncbi:MAG TPA: histidine kinase dimerization/phospho-acceptor domain-containing protein [Steroidobacteraceae bacterium]|nr:histidine kinase dimerization/phospho-acceptor domain-containing protein [Steroidobacteraceae bacterium]
MDDKYKNMEAALAKMAHDLRTPLAVVQTTTNMLLNPKYKFSELQVREQHERIQRNVEIMSRLIGELADLARTVSGSTPDDSGHAGGHGA